MIQQHKNPQHSKLLNPHKTPSTNVYQKTVLKKVAIPKQGIENQSAKWNIGCYTETNIWHVLKEMLGNRTYNILIYIKMVIFKCNKINTETQLL
ncbi:hypothetical protein SAP269_13140 [Spiroplasma ixodetis]|uniref:Uncharacterized protein n=1 Tax=Spiroplasma ixodetis TaxID=2141 RepID=A0ABM8JNK8_9MOLU